MAKGFEIKGYIKLYRNIFDNEVWLAEPLTKAQAWIDLILLANYKDGIITVKNGNIVPVFRGQCGYSIKALSERWKWSRAKVSRFVKYLEFEKMVQQNIVENHSIITILKYNEYQTGEQTEQQTDTNNKGKKEKNIKKVESLKNDAGKNFVAKSFFQKLFTEDGEFYKYSHLKDLFIEFLEYKTAIKKQYKTEKSVRKAFLDFVRLSKNDEKYAHALVDNSIARGWQSIFDLSKEQKIAFQKAQDENQYGEYDRYMSDENSETNNFFPVDYTLGKTETYKGETGWTL